MDDEFLFPITPQAKEAPKTCVLCGGDYVGWGNNPEPVAPYEDGQCCDACNTTKVIPARLARMRGESN